MSECSLHLDADVVQRAARAELGADDCAFIQRHVARCAACAERLSALALVKTFWDEATSESAAVGRARDAAASRAFLERTRRARSRTLVSGLAFALVLSVGVVVIARRTGPPLAIERSGSPQAAVASSPPSAPPARGTLAEAAGARAAPSAKGAIVRGDCAGCRAIAGAGEPRALGVGDRVEAEERLVVPEGARLLLAWSVAEAVSGAREGIAITGPAEAVVEDGGMLLVRGRVEVVTRESTTVRTSQGWASGERARWSVVVDGPGMRVEGAAGRVAVRTARGEERVVGRGTVVSIRDGAFTSSRWGRAAAALPGVPVQQLPPTGEPTPRDEAPSVVPTATATTRLDQAQRLLHAGDRSAAEEILQGILRDGVQTDPVFPRASFRLAEIELARGASPQARSRLRALVSGKDPQLAEDAATLLARSYSTPGERASAWGEYVATSPASPRRERALLEQAHSLAAAGDRMGARILAEGLATSPSPEDVSIGARRLLDRL